MGVSRIGVEMDTKANTFVGGLFLALGASGGLGIVEVRYGKDVRGAAPETPENRSQLSKRACIFGKKVCSRGVPRCHCGGIYSIYVGMLRAA